MSEDWEREFFHETLPRMFAGECASRHAYALRRARWATIQGIIFTTAQSLILAWNIRGLFHDTQTWQLYFDGVMIALSCLWVVLTISLWRYSRKKWLEAAEIWLLFRQNLLEGNFTLEHLRGGEEEE